MNQNFEAKFYVYGEKISEEEIKEAVNAAFSDTQSDCEIDWRGKDAIISVEGTKEVQYFSDECTFEGVEDSGTLFDRIIHIRDILNSKEGIDVDTDIISIFSDSEDTLLNRIREEKSMAAEFGVYGIVA
ncbi:MAG: hypothetical protein SPL49_11265 [Oribacterium sp.]|nr:hypothetical protein [Oribacterium sp.]